jgi:hypothetical protein
MLQAFPLYQASGVILRIMRLNASEREVEVQVRRKLSGHSTSPSRWTYRVHTCSYVLAHKRMLPATNICRSTLREGEPWRETGFNAGLPRF